MLTMKINKLKNIVKSVNLKKNTKIIFNIIYFLYIKHA